jgi:HPt (histidine-containing phosphotransfer) domain-containing protein
MSTAPSTNAAELPAVDPEALTRLERFGGSKLLREMIALYVDSASGRLAAAEAATAAGDIVAAENALHSLKSSSAQLGAIRLSQLCEQGEALARAGTFAGIAEVLRSSREELSRAEAWLAREREARCS